MTLLFGGITGIGADFVFKLVSAVFLQQTHSVGLALCILCCWYCMVMMIGNLQQALISLGIHKRVIVLDFA